MDRKETQARAGVAAAAAEAMPSAPLLGYLSVIGPTWLIALIPHVEELSKRRSWGADRLQASPPENAHGCAVIVLAMAMLESYLTSEVHRARAQQRPARPRPEEVTREDMFQLPAVAGMTDELWEAATLRDLVTHDHLWRIEYTGDPGTASLRVISARWEAGRSKGIAGAVIDQASGTTRPNGLRAVPTAVGRPEAAQVLLTMARALDALAKHGSPIGWLRSDYRGRRGRTLLDIASDFHALVARHSEARRTQRRRST